MADPYPPDTRVIRPNRPSRMFNVQFAELQGKARAHHLPVSTMARSWLLERLDQETSRRLTTHNNSVRKRIDQPGRCELRLLLQWTLSYAELVGFGISHNGPDGAPLVVVR